ncbi:MAG TPA: DNA alkylation repair protein [Verrucomicrobiae bacterium]|nr:DNA alkylation repair protein [Verrucomicrobiae bacterium]
MTAKEILEELKPLGSDSYKRVMLKHGVKEPFFGVKISDLHKIVKRIKKDLPGEMRATRRVGETAKQRRSPSRRLAVSAAPSHGVNQLALDLYDTGNYDAMYLAGLIADDAQMTKADLQRWAAQAYCGGLRGATVPWVASGGRYGWELAREWIDSKKPSIAEIGWATLSSLVSIKPDSDLDVAALKQLLQRVQRTIHASANLVRYQMNAFVISVGCYVASLTEAALQTAEKIGKVTVDMGDTACQVPDAKEYIRKVQQRGTIGKKRKTAKC